MSKSSEGIKKKSLLISFFVKPHYALHKLNCTTHTKKERIPFHRTKMLSIKLIEKKRMFKETPLFLFFYFDHLF